MAGMTSSDSDTHTLFHIRNKIASEALELWWSKARDNDVQGFLLLGARGQFVEINRKFWKLFKSIWRDDDLRHEQPDEVMMDMIGHLYLMIYCWRKEHGLLEEDDKPGGRGGPEF